MMDKCIRCDEELESDVAVKTGICPECWKESDELNEEDK